MCLFRATPGDSQAFLLQVYEEVLIVQSHNQLALVDPTHF